MKQSSIEFLAEKLFDPSSMVNEQLEWLEQAKAMHKEEIIKAVKYGYNKEYFTPNFRDQEELFEQYYNETFNTKEK